MRQESSNILKIAAVILTVSALTVTAAQADVAKGQKLYSKTLKKACGFTGAKTAGMHTQDEWESINEVGGLKAEIEKICPKAKGIKDKYLPHLYDFFYEFGSDSGNVPSC